jgi:hypothetical protein
MNVFIYGQILVCFEPKLLEGTLTPPFRHFFTWRKMQGLKIVPFLASSGIYL